MTEERLREVWLALAAGQYPNRYWGLLREYGTAGEIYAAAVRGDIRAAGGNDRLAEELHRNASDAFLDGWISHMEKESIRPVLFDDSTYPALLREIYFPPPVLYVKGELPDEIDLPIAVIGSRKNTDYGAEVAEKLSGELAKCGACIVSGMAYGIDSIAAKAALKEGKGCATIAVLGSGVDVVYPRENAYLYDQICERGAVVSEFLPGTKPDKYNFPRRNRVISGVSKGLLVIEASRQSGTNITVDFALEQGRDVFAVPGRITDINSEGTNYMIREGMAKAVFHVKDILEEYGLNVDARERGAKVDESQLSREEQAIFRLLKAGDKSIDQLCELTGMAMGPLNSSLTGMELSGIIKQSPGRMYGL